MTHIGIMIEDQEDLTWERFFRLAQGVEDLGNEQRTLEPLRHPNHGGLRPTGVAFPGRPRRVSF